MSKNYVTEWSTHIVSKAFSFREQHMIGNDFKINEISIDVLQTNKWFFLQNVQKAKLQTHG